MRWRCSSLKVQKLKKICVITFENRERCFFSSCHERGTKEKNSESPWGIAPQTFGFRAPMFYHWSTKTRRWARSIAIYFFTEHKTHHLSYSISKHDAIDTADPSCMQDAYHTNFVIDLANCRVSEVDIFSRTFPVCLPGVLASCVWAFFGANLLSFGWEF